MRVGFLFAILLIALAGCANDEPAGTEPPGATAEAPPRQPTPAPPPTATLPQPGVLDVAPPEAAARVTVAELQSQPAGTNLVLVDVRSPQAYALEHAEGAVNIPLEEIATRGRELPPGAKIVTYCT